MLVTMAEMLNTAKKGNYAVAAPNAVSYTHLLKLLSIFIPFQMRAEYFEGFSARCRSRGPLRGVPAGI